MKTEGGLDVGDRVTLWAGLVSGPMVAAFGFSQDGGFGLFLMIVGTLIFTLCCAAKALLAYSANRRSSQP
jgi:uncharacterized membrane protein YkvI